MDVLCSIREEFEKKKMNCYVRENANKEKYLWNHISYCLIKDTVIPAEVRWNGMYLWRSSEQRQCHHGFQICLLSPHGKWSWHSPSVSNGSLVVSSQATFHVALKERGGLEHHVLPFPGNTRCWSLLVEESGATTGWLLPPAHMGRDLPAVTAGSSRREMWATASSWPCKEQLRQRSLFSSPLLAWIWDSWCWEQSGKKNP